MKRTVVVVMLLALLLIPSIAFALVEPEPMTSYGNTYYSNVPGWSLRFETWFRPMSSTTVSVTKQYLTGKLSSTTVYAPIWPFSFYNTSGYVGPITATLHSNGTQIYSSTKTGTYWRNPGETASFTWYPSKTGKREATYGKVTITWGQVLNSVYDSKLSSPKPCVIRTATF